MYQYIWDAPLKWMFGLSSFKAVFKGQVFDYDLLDFTTLSYIV